MSWVLVLEWRRKSQNTLQSVSLEIVLVFDRILQYVVFILFIDPINIQSQLGNLVALEKLHRLAYK